MARAIDYSQWSIEKGTDYLEWSIPFCARTSALKASDRHDGRMSQSEPSLSGVVGAFGEYLMKTAYDVAIRDTRLVLNGGGASDQAKALHARLASLSDDERLAVAEVGRQAVVSALHGLLHGLSHDEDRIALTFDGENVAAASDGLHGDLFRWIDELSVERG